MFVKIVHIRYPMKLNFSNIDINTEVFFSEKKSAQYSRVLVFNE